MTKRKALGQHFLTSRAVLKKIIAVISPQKDELIIEIGPGKGALTFPLAERSAKLIAIEKDTALIPFLRENAKKNIIILEQDVLRADFRKVFSAEPGFRGKVKLVGNLPYSISTPLLFKVLADKDLIPECIFLLQKEVAERVAARSGSKKYAPLSILFQFDYEVRLHFDVAPGAFSPPPRVQSTLVSLHKRAGPLIPVSDRVGFHRFLRTAFGQRRKTLLNNLKNYPFAVAAVKNAFSQLALSENVRAEQLPIDRLVELFDRLTNRS
jgi:16S rRNA (adenine1518-N6/adenine1519-N6)-dimethyltransferase